MLAAAFLTIRYLVSTKTPSIENAKSDARPLPPSLLLYRLPVPSKRNSSSQNANLQGVGENFWAQLASRSLQTVFLAGFATLERQQTALSSGRLDVALNASEF
jgi:hypothetical protein